MNKNHRLASVTTAERGTNKHSYCPDVYIHVHANKHSHFNNYPDVHVHVHVTA
jgi:DnaJ-class molecular chaperone